MQLDEFITESLKQIFTGISDAKSFAADHGFQVNPWITFGQSDMSGILIEQETKTPVQIVEFDVAVTTVASEQSKRGAGIRVFGLDLGGHGQADASNSTVSRLKFSVPIAFPRASKTPTGANARPVNAVLPPASQS